MLRCSTLDQNADLKMLHSWTICTPQDLTLLNNLKTSMCELSFAIFWTQYATLLNKLIPQDVTPSNNLRSQLVTFLNNLQTSRCYTICTSQDLTILNNLQTSRYYTVEHTADLNMVHSWTIWRPQYGNTLNNLMTSIW